ncbi:MAG: glycerol-3-phosphate dehydrogenase/oxidase [Acidobacteriaceae bacterium]|nr:glycerol-3-phosphate dehydrogenase/oxidase [Acidobacteriaceae bacterium]
MTAKLLREDFLREIGENREWDLIVAGGGATGLGTALEAVSRGYRTLLLEAEDFAKATSSRSTKLVHGGVRYLQQGDLKLVLEALRERGRMLRNASHLVHRRSFVIPIYALWELPFYGAGLTAYDLLAGRESIGRSRILARRGTRQALPTVRDTGLKGGVLYYDGQFDDARYAIALLRTFVDLGGTALNYARVTGLVKSAGNVSGVVATDGETGERFECCGRVVVNAAGIFSDELRAMDEPATEPVIAVSQGSHFVLPRRFLPGNSAMMIPRTSDGRVLFAIPWHEHVLVGTTDDPVPEPRYEPQPMPDERRFLMKHIEQFLGGRPDPAEIQSVWSGQRPLVRQGDATRTAAISRDHTVLISTSKLVTITGGKWTTYRRMGEDVVDRAAPLAGLPSAPSKTANLRLHGWSLTSEVNNDWERVYGADLPLLHSLAEEDPDLDKYLHPELPFRKAEVVWAARYEMARTVEDVLARRTRALFLNARASIEAAPETVRLLAKELGRSEEWQEEQLSRFRTLAAQYVWSE